MESNLFNLSGKVAVITGGNGGIGLGIASGLASAGASIIIAARDQAKTDQAVKQLETLGTDVIGTTTDVSDEISVRQMVKTTLDRFGAIDILVNNAGTTVRKAPQEYTLEEWNHVFDINMTGTYLSAREAYAPMVENGGGKIINIGSMTSIFGSDWVSAYAATKGGVVQLTKSLAVAWAKDNIQVNSILPGWIHTNLTSAIRTGSPERYEFITSRIPNGRWGEPADLSGTAVFLARAASNYVTGASFPVDGGYTSF